MAWIPLYLNKEDEKELLDLLNSEEQIAFLVSDGNKKWKAVKSLTEFTTDRISLWHNESGPLPLLTESGEDEWIENPWNGWTEKRTGANPITPYFGAGWPGVIHLNIKTDYNDEIGMSSFEWIGNHYSIIGISASDTTKKFWSRLKRQIGKRSTKLPRADFDGAKNEIYTFQSALVEIKNGKERRHNP
ncbi:hypothetical protein [Aquimarina sp. Aq78]|uniref:hypothetical protein n=1 Tax=Aquimarina sp. Aq78 TaxID=1191889 RepID=UPI0020C225EB|nr:hypothetical protein [Aquimarina sp. Aq78]